VEPPLPRGPVLERLDALVGTWEMSAMSSSGTVAARAIVTLDWTEDAFLLQRTVADPSPDAPDEWGENSPFPTVAIIGLDDSTGGFSYAYADGRGVHRTYSMEFDGTTWTISGKAREDFRQRFTGAVGERSIEARWERSEDGETWELDFESSYRRIEAGAGSG
jgi:hypothetical protein